MNMKHRWNDTDRETEVTAETSVTSYLRLYMEVKSHQLHAPATLPPGERLPLPVEQETVRIPETIWTIWRREKPFALCWESKMIPPHYCD